MCSLHGVPAFSRLFWFAFKSSHALFSLLRLKVSHSVLQNQKPFVSVSMALRKVSLSIISINVKPSDSIEITLTLRQSEFWILHVICIISNRHSIMNKAWSWSNKGIFKIENYPWMTVDVFGVRSSPLNLNGWTWSLVEACGFERVNTIKYYCDINIIINNKFCLK